MANSLGGAQDPDYLALSNSLRPPAFKHLPDDFKELGPEFRAAQPASLQQWRELARTTFPGGKRAPSQAMKNTISFTALEGLNVPTLFLTGDADLYSPPATVKLYADRIPGAAFISVPAVGHSLYWEQPETFNRTVLNFIANRNNGI
ncbi:MAG: hypothetical protein A3H35_18715 [Betaproteobacteria bacterium RIFCSPLOWO2_02_FULL_62_17]|nr:MAG: hypothetical protein A3H35_18715 [Betaproteobacteria bacterium RIFCSPLOWO2_02_FULL_62_17]